MRKVLIWAGTGVGLGAAAGIANAVAPASDFSVLMWVLFGLWAAACIVAVSWLFWRWITYRVGVRLFVSYLLVGITPFFFAALFSGIALFMLMGQYTSVRSGSHLERRLGELRGICRSVLLTAGRQGADAVLDRLSMLDGAPVAGFEDVIWIARLDGREVFRSGSATELPEPAWIGPGVTEVFVYHEGAAWAMVAVAGEDPYDLIAALVPLSRQTGRALGTDAFFQVSFAVPGGGGDDESDNLGIHASAGGEEGIVVSFSEHDAEILWDPWIPDGEGIWNSPFVAWFRKATGVRDLETGDTEGVPAVISLLRTSPARVWDDFVLSRAQLSSGLQTAWLAFGTFFLIVYGLALAIAATMIVSITRSAARLSSGARAVEHGNLDYRIPVKRRDQLGDLALSFNQMTQSVQNMIAQVADRERLAHELELAREIQQSLLPDRHLRHGSLTVQATFRPATEVGGDYFDIFPLSEDRLVVVVGDVAGHGLHTGLLMASLKSSVAALIHEGYFGTELIDRVNRLVVEQSASRTMATLAVFEIDPGDELLTVTSAGHPPAYLLGGEKGCDELLAGSLPLGSPLTEPRMLERTFDAGSSLVVYSDGLVEALDSRGEPFGFQRLADLLQVCVGLGGGEIVATVLGALDRHTGGGDLDDDLTLVVVDSGAQSPEGD